MKMPEISAAKKQPQKRDRLLNAILTGGKTLVVSFAKTLYALWLEVTGLMFAIFTVMGGSALFKQYRANHFSDRKHFWSILAFMVICGWFTLVSFVRAKKTRKR